MMNSNVIYMENCSSIEITNPTNYNISCCHTSVGRNSKSYIPMCLYMYLSYQKLKQSKAVIFQCLYLSILVTSTISVFTSNVIVFVSSSGVQNIQYLPATSKSTANVNSSHGSVDIAGIFPKIHKEMVIHDE